MFSTQVFPNHFAYMNPPYRPGFDVGMSTNTSQGVPWTHEIPPQMPWSAPVDPRIMTFVAQPQQLFSPNPPSTSVPAFPQPVITKEPPICEWKFPRPNFPIKRRNSSSDEDDIDVEPPTKVHAGADKVAAKLSHLDIDSDNDRLIVEELSDDAIENLDEDICENDQPVVHLSDEVLCAFSTSQTDSVNSLLQEELDKNKKAVVLWRPPRSFIQTALDDDDDLSTGVKIEEIIEDDDRMETS